MKILGVLLLWLVLFWFCWPLALLGLLLWPVAWIISLPFRILAYVVNGILSLLKNILLFPGRLLAFPFRS